MPSINDAKVVVFSKGKSEMTYTGEWFKKHKFCDAVFVLSKGDNRNEYEKTTGCKAVLSDSFNLASKRQWAMDFFCDDGEWLYFFEDNIIRVTGVTPERFMEEEIRPTTRMLYHKVEYSPQQVLKIMQRDTKVATSLDAWFGGYACNDNHFFRSRKYRDIAFVWTKMGYVRQGGPRWPTYLNEMDDFGMTAECLMYSGRTLVNNFLYPWSKRYEGRGGSRTLEERAEDKRKSVKLLLSRFPNLFRPKEKAGCPSGTELQLRFHSKKQVEKWREEMNQSS